MSRKTRLELTWIGKDERLRLEPRILIEDTEKSLHALARGSGDIFQNVLVRGDNLLALKALEAEFSGKIKCVFIDPPYNTGSAFEHYDDGIKHSLWLSLIRDRLEILKRLLLPEGSIWITIDDNESHYLKVLCDEVFGRINFVSNVVWQKTLTRRNDARTISNAHDHILVYAKEISAFKVQHLPADEKQRATYRNRDNDPRGDWLAVPFHAPNLRPNLTYPIVTPGGKTLWPPKGRCWSTTKEKFAELVSDNRIYFGQDGNGMAQRKKFWAESSNSIVPWTWWTYQEAGDNREANREAKEISEAAGIETPFATPKPEKLVKRVLEIATQPGDIVLDSFAGSGTTGAVAHKMKRRWVMVESGEQCDTHILPRLKLVINGADLGGITEEVDWKGGGGFRYFHLAPSLIETDRWDNAVLSKKYNSAMLAEAMCKHLGFTYSPSGDLREYWKHGHSSERDFIYVTTASMTGSALRGLSEDVGLDQTLLVCCKAFDVKADAFENLTLKKIPQAVLASCEWGRDDYSLSISRLPDREDNDSRREEPGVRPKTRRKPADESPSLFDKGE